MKATRPLWLLLASAGVLAQSLPPPSRTVYKCEVNGKVSYSDSPCLGASKVDAEPTRGLNQSTGRELVGQDVSRERQREQLAEAARPLTGMDAKRFEQAGRRQRLSPEIQRRCLQWEQQIPATEAVEKTARTSAELAAAQQRLFALRSAYRKAGCD
jgi:hypothetical protein